MYGSVRKLVKNTTSAKMFHAVSRSRVLRILFCEEKKNAAAYVSCVRNVKYKPATFLSSGVHADSF